MTINIKKSFIYGKQKTYFQSSKKYIIINNVRFFFHTIGTL